MTKPLGSAQQLTSHVCFACDSAWRQCYHATEPLRRRFWRLEGAIKDEYFNGVRGFDCKGVERATDIHEAEQTSRAGPDETEGRKMMLS